MAAEAQAPAAAPTLAAELATAAPVKAPAVEAPADPPAEVKAEKSEKGKKDKGKKGKKASAPAEEAGGEPSISAHPRAARAVARAKSWGGLGGFLIGGYLSLPTATPVDAGLRALLAGIVCYVAAWAGAVFAWRRLVVIEIKAREQQLLAATQGAQGQPDALASSGPGRAGARAGS
jgi:hypothetical protein